MTETTQQQPEFMIQRIYVKDISFESPLAPLIFNESIQPGINLNIQTAATNLSNDLYEVVLAITVTAATENKTIFLVEIKQAGIFAVKNFAPDQLNAVLGSTCPTILFPYARERISDLVASGGFPHFYLSPVNFEALYLQNLEQQKQQASSIIMPATETTH